MSASPDPMLRSDECDVLMRSYPTKREPETSLLFSRPMLGWEVHKELLV